MKYKIQTLNGFKMYFDQIINVFKAKYDNDEDINLDNLAEITGLNRRKARIILNYLADLGLSQKVSLKRTELGRIIHKYDDFMENEGTLWVMHYLQGTNPYIIIWNRVLNYIYDIDFFERGELLNLFENIKDEIKESTFKKHVGQEIWMIIDAYINQRLSNLDIIEKWDKKYKVNKNPEVPNLILLAAIKRYQEINYPGATSIAIKEIATYTNSPGRIFLIDEYTFRQKLEELKNKGYIGIESRADLDQIRIRTDKGFEEIIEVYYGGKEWN